MRFISSFYAGKILAFYIMFSLAIDAFTWITGQIAQMMDAYGNYALASLIGFGGILVLRMIRRLL